MILGCIAAQRLYGRDVADAGLISELFHRVLGGEPAELVLKAFEFWIARSPEMPTPSDILGLIRRKGKPPHLESRYIAIQRKDPADRTYAETLYCRDFEAEQDRGWEEHNPETPPAPRQSDEVLRLRAQIARIRAENAKLAELLERERERWSSNADLDQAPHPPAHVHVEPPPRSYDAAALIEELKSEFTGIPLFRPAVWHDRK
jgi:hypothetical protein